MRAISFVVGLTVGMAITLILTSQDWLIASLRHNLSWESGRQWFAAASGWVAAVGAIIAAGVTLPQLKRQADEAKRQADEAKRQTDFVTGIGEPLFSVLSTSDAKGGKCIFIDNFTNIPIEVIGVRTVPGDDATPFDIHTIRVDGKTDFEWANSVARKKSVPKPIFIDSWRDRARAPSRCKIILIPRDDLPIPPDARVRVDYKAGGVLRDTTLRL